MAIPFILLGLIGSVIGMIYTMLYTKPKDLNTQESMKY
jgi:hypothetical protein